ncbi:hypothetical protein CEXT_136541 [Caerostris extrusa]|uniref:Uncharacterized protein n=1 Tax=Caerostris extrusa TaxID=172846 RepID=A0AAV4RGV5_CAEEX|nr:hypothetical protein CEXT_136541 [Caerostris extrusa]
MMNYHYSKGNSFSLFESNKIPFSGKISLNTLKMNQAMSAVAIDLPSVKLYSSDLRTKLSAWYYRSLIQSFE